MTAKLNVFRVDSVQRLDTGLRIGKNLGLAKQSEIENFGIQSLPLRGEWLYVPTAKIHTISAELSGELDFAQCPAKKTTHLFKQRVQIAPILSRCSGIRKRNSVHIVARLYIEPGIGTKHGAVVANTTELDSNHGGFVPLKLGFVTNTLVKCVEKLKLKKREIFLWTT
jgi:hypothetical protein